jgi:hypothetical protein
MRPAFGPSGWTVCAALTVVLIACSKKEEPTTSSVSASDYHLVALEFIQALAARDYPKAYAMTSEGYRRINAVERLRAAFDAPRASSSRTRTSESSWALGPPSMR